MPESCTTQQKNRNEIPLLIDQGAVIATQATWSNLGYQDTTLPDSLQSV